MSNQFCFIDGATFDFIVVGAGTAGSVVAARLAEDNKTRVMLIEAGGDPPDEGKVSHISLNFYFEFTTNKATKIKRQQRD